MKSAQEVRRITNARRAELMDGYQRRAVSLVHGPIARRILEVAEQGSAFLKYHVDATYCLNFVVEELESFGYMVKVQGRVVIIDW